MSSQEQPSDRKPSKLVIALIWLSCFVLIGFAYQHYSRSAAATEGQAPETSLPPVAETKPPPSAPARRTDPNSRPCRLFLDSYPGYAILQAPGFREALAKEGMALELIDDGADYEKRTAALASGEAQSAAFTIDAFIKACAKHGRAPGSIVAILTESRGADAVLASRSDVAGVQALNDSRTRVYASRNSPSEFLANIMVSSFDLPDLSDNWLVLTDSPEALYEAFAKNGVGERQVYVCWEPYLSRMLKREPAAHVLLSSEHVEGYILDVLVAHPDVVAQPAQLRAILAAYFETLRSARAPDVAPDGESSKARSQWADGGVTWKTVGDNYQFFGLWNADPVKHIETSMRKVVDVLVRAGTLEAEPFAGDYVNLYSAQALRALLDGEFDPLGELTEPARQDPTTPVAAPLSAAEWATLKPVARMRVPSIRFARGRADVKSQGKLELGKLQRMLDSWPEYDLRIVGHARRVGDYEANRRLSQQRADKVRQYLAEKGVPEHRLMAICAEEEQHETGNQTVSFMLLQR